MERMTNEQLGLSDHQMTIGDRVIAEESKKREHLSVYLSGAHAYGFPSPDSDLDLKCIHIAPTSRLVGFELPAPTYDRAEIIEEVEIDYTSNEIANVLGGILAGNGNFLERILGSTVLAAARRDLETLRPLTHATLSRRFHRHYRGFAVSQQKALAEEPTIKKLLYVLRTALTGTHLLRTGELEIDLRVLAPKYDLADVAILIEAKRAGERIGANPAIVAEWEPRLGAILSGIDQARDASPLPDEPSIESIAALEAWLIAIRKSRF